MPSEGESLLHGGHPTYKNPHKIPTQLHRRQRESPSNLKIRGADGTPNGSRTRVSAVRGRHPWPLDDGSPIECSLGCEPRIGPTSWAPTNRRSVDFTAPKSGGRLTTDRQRCQTASVGHRSAPARIRRSAMGFPAATNISYKPGPVFCPVMLTRMG